MKNEKSILNQLYSAYFKDGTTPENKDVRIDSFEIIADSKNKFLLSVIETPEQLCGVVKDNKVDKSSVICI